jgi:hypothetical protein
MRNYEGGSTDRSRRPLGVSGTVPYRAKFCQLPVFGPEKVGRDDRYTFARRRLAKEGGDMDSLETEQRGNLVPLDHAMLDPASPFGECVARRCEKFLQS